MKFYYFAVVILYLFGTPKVLAKPNYALHQLLVANNTHRVVGGMDVPPGQYVPYQVSLQYFTKKGEYKHFCGGSIISERHILTAAHCCEGMNVSRMSVLAGVRDMNEARSGQRSQVVSYDIHESYEELVMSDIALIYIDPPLQLDDVRVAAISVDSTERVNGGVPVTLTGWGLRLPLPLPFLPETWETVNYPSVLQTMNYQTTTNWQCQEKGMTDLTDTEICALGAPLKGACSGDSGGPLVMSTENGLRQVGIVSYGLVICGVFDVPDVYTRVSMFDYWIKERMSK